MSRTSVFLNIENISKSFVKKSTLFASSSNKHNVLTNISFDIYKSERLAIIGETGSGKTTLGKCMIRLTPASSGKILHEDVNILDMPSRDFQKYRKMFQMIFQNPSQALNPRKKVISSITEPLRVICGLKGIELKKQANKLISLVQLGDELFDRYPEELSGGQKQRVAIARALAVNPSFIVADEPTSYLDATLKRTIIELINSLWEKFGLTLILISHDLGMVAHVSDRIAVLYQGRLIEIADSRSLLNNSLHPYTRQLIDFGKIHPKDPPISDINDEQRGCPYVIQCDQVQDQCLEKMPPIQFVSPNHGVACLLYSKVKN